MTTIWLLVLTVSGDVDTVQVRAGAMATEPLCQMAGDGVATELMRRVDGVTVTWTCQPMAPGVAV